MHQSVDLLVEADFLYPMTQDRPVIQGGEVAISADRIVYAGPARPTGTWAARRKIDARGHVVMPGFINAHCHAASIVFRSQTDDPPGGITLYTIGFRGEPQITAPEWHDLAHVGAIDMIKAGITTINDIYFAPDGLAAAVETTGLRAQLCDEIFDVKKENLAGGDYTRYPDIGVTRLKRSVEFHSRWHGKANGRITTRLGPHAVDTCAPELHREIAAEARRLGLGLHVHAAQSAREVEVVKAMYGRSSLEHLGALGVLGPDTVLAHLTFASQADLDCVRDAGARYAHCPTIYPRRGVYPDVPGIRARSIPMGFATDWMMNDPFEGMRNAINALRLRSGNVDALTTSDALWFATMGSAQVLGLDADIGSLEAGKKADLILVHVERPHLEPYYGDPASLVYYARAADVVTSIVDGRIIMEAGRVCSVDELTVLAAARKHLPRFSGLMKQLGGVSRLGACPCGSH
ncbi:MAG: amidohydrolase family protein [Hyphomicrobiaceae bacterium]